MLHFTNLIRSRWRLETYELEYSRALFLTVFALCTSYGVGTPCAHGLPVQSPAKWKTRTVKTTLNNKFNATQQNTNSYVLLQKYWDCFQALPKRHVLCTIATPEEIKKYYFEGSRSILSTKSIDHRKTEKTADTLLNPRMTHTKLYESVFLCNHYIIPLYYSWFS